MALAALTILVAIGAAVVAAFVVDRSEEDDVGEERSLAIFSIDASPSSVLVWETAIRLT